MRLIDADGLKKSIEEDEELKGNSLAYLLMNLMTCYIDEAPTIDAEPVRHGHWIKNNDRDGWNCSICHKDDCYAYLYNYDTDVEDIQDYYCPNCGAKMIEVSE